MFFVLRRYLEDSIKKMKYETEYTLNLLDQYEVVDPRLRRLIRRALKLHQRIVEEMERI